MLGPSCQYRGTPDGGESAKDGGTVDEVLWRRGTLFLLKPN